MISISFSRPFPISPEERSCARPITERILRLYAHAQRHKLLCQESIVQTVEIALTQPQQEALDLLGVLSPAFRNGLPTGNSRTSRSRSAENALTDLRSE